MKGIKGIGKSSVWFAFLICSIVFENSCRSVSNKQEPKQVLRRNCGSFEIEIAVFDEIRDFAQVLAGEEYVVSSKSIGQDGYSEIFKEEHDDGNRAQIDNIGCVGPNIGFAFAVDTYSTTKDSGKNWRVSKLDKQYQGCLIASMKLEPTGRGVLTLECDKNIELLPIDFGWKY